MSLSSVDPGHTGAVHVIGRLDPRVERSQRHIPEIDGLRAVAIGLVVVYHIWLNRVSGGVDVFLLLSGFFITLSLTREVRGRGRIGFARYYARIVRRIAPPALLILVGVVVATLLWIPQVRWREIFTEVVASALYLENWQLAQNSVDYLAAQNAASPVQHYWSLAIQGQFYLVWPLLVVIAVAVARRMSIRPQVAVAAMCAVVFAVSLAYAVRAVQADPAYAYFDTFARLWEFALGGLLGLALPRIRVSRRLKLPLGWAGVIALCIGGLIFQGDEFPGFAALWPTSAAGLVIAGVSSHSRFGVDRLLRSAPLRYIGGISYALYLWHWPVLICYLAVTDRTMPSVKGGTMIIASSVLLSAVTTWLLGDRLRSLGIGQRTTAGGFALGAVCLSAALAATAVAHAIMNAQTTRGPLDTSDYPGAVYLAAGGALRDVPYRPAALDAKKDRAALYELECFQKYRSDEVRACEFGPPDPELTIALVGGSHSAHWFPALEVLAERNRWQVVTMIKSSCPLTADEMIYRGETYPSCSTWNDNVIDEVATRRPDIVVTTSTRGDADPEDTPEGYVEQWRKLDDLGIAVVAIRDTPWHGSQIPECVELHGATSDRCGGPRASYGLDRPAKVLSRPDIPDNVTFIDMTDYVCDDVRCPGVIGNVLIYHDSHHLTATYARSMATYLDDAMSGVAGRLTDR